MQLSTVFLNALIATRGLATALPKQHHARLTDIGVMGEISQIPKDEIAPAGTETVFSEHTSPSHGLSKRVQFGLCLGHDGVPSRTITKYKSDVGLVFDQIAQWNPRSQRTVGAHSSWRWSGPTFGGYNRVEIIVRNQDNCRDGTFTTGDLQQFLALVLRDCSSTRSGWAFVSSDPVLVAIIHDKSTNVPAAHLTC
ncbi:uncharacterized protein FTOL_00802 [Fusarium torulosum]|uniref:Uncharacterized protein n=1 Tax=Fusarium torulosum TaxID=33205 RepID=A0AAE8LYT8_9HYPO|nr:uncharacterized protein FTOL_00802 [Fusarium torulosum]